jgi:hypothetical protein
VGREFFGAGKRQAWNVDMKQARGLRNNNPGNIRHSSARWQGASSIQRDAAFVTFDEPAWGIRALARVLLRYQDRHGLTTVRGIIGRWAPPSENDTEAYIRMVTARMGVGPNDDLNLHNHADLDPLVRAIIWHENGSQPYPQDVIDRALLLAGVPRPAKPLAATKTVVGTGSTGAGIGLDQVADPVSNSIAPMLTDAGNQLQFAAELSTWIKAIAGLLIVGGIALTIYGRVSVRRRTGE